MAKMLNQGTIGRLLLGLLGGGLLGDLELGDGLGLLLLKLGGELLVPGDGLLGVVLVEDLASPVSAGALGDAELVALEVGGGGEGLDSLDLLGGTGLGPLAEDVLLLHGGLDDGGLGVAGNVGQELGGLNVLDVLDVAPHLAVLGVLDKDAVGVDDVGDDSDLVLTGTTADAHEAADLDVVGVHHFYTCNKVQK
eukprot:23282_1